MPKPKNTYIELDENGNLYQKLAESRNVQQIHDVFKNMDGYSKISKHLITLKVKNKIQSVGIFRLVPEGLHDVLERKRVQISKGDLSSLPDHMIAVYINGKNVIFIKILIDSASILDMPPGVTNLFRVSIRSLLPASYDKVIAIGVKSRRKMATLLISKNIDLLLSRSSSLEHPVENVYDFGQADLESEKKELLELKSTEKIDEMYGLLEQKIIGRRGELLVFQDFKNNGPIKKSVEVKIGQKIEDVRWLNYECESYANHDFVLNNAFPFEVKTSSIPGSASFYISQKELELSQSNSSYLLVKINILEKAEKILLDSHLLFDGKEISELEKTVTCYKVSI